MPGCPQSTGKKVASSNEDLETGSDHTHIYTRPLITPARVEDKATSEMITNAKYKIRTFYIIDTKPLLYLILFDFGTKLQPTQ